MNLPKVRRQLILLISPLVFFFGLAFLNPVHAAILTRTDIPLDERLSDQTQNSYAAINGVSVVRLTAPASVQFDDSGDWVKGLYYYSITNLHFTDIPFNYVVTWQGDVYKVKGGGNEALPLLSESSSAFRNTILVAYFDNNREITNSGQQALTEALSQIISEAQISNVNIFPVSMSMEQGQGAIPISHLILTASSDSAWVAFVDSVKTSVTSTSVPRNYSASVTSVDYTADVSASQNFVVKAVVQNTGDYPWYNSGDNLVYLATSEPRGHDSSYYVSDDWASFSRIAPIDKNWVLPGESATFEFSIKTPLIPGEYTEKFELLRLPDIWISGSQFEVKFGVQRGDFNLVEILDTETGYLTVRDCPSVNCGEVGKVVPGDIVINLGAEDGWYRIKWNGTDEGWVYGKYVKEI